uniref:Uncharacterized protein n=1 Tax=Steinernema glaseri TaxID=37863 RepID=A0A1I7Y6U9_9BILA
MNFTLYLLCFCFLCSAILSSASINEKGLHERSRVKRQYYFPRYYNPFSTSRYVEAYPGLYNPSAFGCIICRGRMR